jgi:peptide/nickel transport system permease protein
MARLKGLKPWRIVVGHALRNSLIPVVTMTSVQFGYFVGGSVLVEVVYLWPGVGTYAFNSTVSLDYAPVMGVTLVTSFVFISVNLIVDLLYPVLDPRIKLTGAR